MSSLGDLISDLTSGDDGRAEQAAIELPKYKEDGLSELKRLVQYSDPDIRWWVARALAGFQDAEAGDLLGELLSDPDIGVRQCATLSLGVRPHPGAVSQLIATLNSDDGLLARLAADSLAVIGAAAVEPLLTALDSGSAAARVEAARALALIGDTRAIPALFKLLDSDSITLQHWANEGLEKTGVGMSFFKP